MFALRLLVVLVTAVSLTGSCAQNSLLHPVRLEPPPVSKEAVRVTVKELAFSDDFLGIPTRRLNERSTLALRVTVENRGPSLASVDLGLWRVFATGFQQREVAARPTLLTESRPIQPAEPMPPIEVSLDLKPGERHTFWIAFAGFGALDARGGLALRLEGPEAVPPGLTLAAPAAPAPRWEQTPRLAFSAALRTSTATGSHRIIQSGDFEFLFARGRFCYGMSLDVLGLMQLERDDGHESLLTQGLGLRVGWLSYDWPVGILAGPSVSFVTRRTPAGRMEDAGFGFVSLLATVRYSFPHLASPSQSILPLETPPSPFRNLFLDVSYVHWLGHGTVPSGPGLIASGGVAFHN